MYKSCAKPEKDCEGINKTSYFDGWTKLFWKDNKNNLFIDLGNVSVNQNAFYVSNNN